MSNFILEAGWPIYFILAVALVSLALARYAELIGERRIIVDGPSLPRGVVAARGRARRHPQRRGGPRRQERRRPPAGHFFGGRGAFFPRRSDTNSASLLHRR
jgi:hypothetical protein